MDEQDVFDEETEVDEGTEQETETTKESEKGVEAEEESKDESESQEEPPASESKSVPMSALIAERRRRQEAEEELQKSRSSKAPDPVTDPEGYEQHQAAEKIRDRIELTQDLARDAYEDYEEMEKVFMDMVSTKTDDGIKVTDETLYRKFISSANPAKFAYQQAKEYQGYLEKTSDDYEKKVEQKVLKRLKEAGALSVDAADLPDLTNAADVLSNNSLEETRDPDRIDVFDE